MGKAVMITLLLTLSVAFAEVWDGGVVNKADEFTGKTTCGQRVDNNSFNSTGMTMMRASDGNLVFTIRHTVDDWLSDSAFNMFGKVGDEKVYIKFTNDDILILEPLDVSGDMDGDTETAYFISDVSTMSRILSSPNALRVRFSGPDGNEDFDIHHDVVVKLAQGFGRTCL